MKKLETLKTNKLDKKYASLLSIADEKKLQTLPFTIRILLEAAFRNLDGFVVTERDLEQLLNWKPKDSKRQEIAFKPGRVILQDFTGVPAVVDLAALRNAMKAKNGDPQKINPLVNVDLVIDHSVQVDYFGDSRALENNMKLEFERNKERYEFLKWGEGAFKNFRIVPPGAGIVHQVNLEYLASVVLEKEGVVYPDTLVGTDSHTTMINGLGVLGWGVGGIEAEAVMLGQPIFMLVPDVVGVRLYGKPKAQTSATDVVLTLTQMLRKHGVVDKFVEYFGPGLSNLSLPDRATIANMAPEYGATCGYFPVDIESLDYLKQTGRSQDLIELVEMYYKAQGLFRTDATKDPEYTSILELDLGSVEPCLAGPRRPQDRLPLKEIKKLWQLSLSAPIKERGYALEEGRKGAKAKLEGSDVELKHGDVVIAAITSCTNTSNPELMLAAGLLAKKAVERGLKVQSHVKTSLAPGSRVVSDYLERAGLNTYLENLGFYTVGYGCTTCIGNSGPLPEPVVKAIKKEDLIASAVLSGNRNFEGRISPHVKANFLASPPLVVAYALMGTVDKNPESDAIGLDSNKKEVFLRDLWPSHEEVRSVLKKVLSPEMYTLRYAQLTQKGSLWEKIETKKQVLYDWQAESTYIQEPDFFKDMPTSPPKIKDIVNARCLVKLGDSVTTDHISPAGSIPEDMPAGKYLLSKGVVKADFNSFGARRGNDRVMTRGTFGNIRLRNQLTDVEGSWTSHQPSGEKMTIFDASVKYKQENIPLIILSGAEYGTGSSRDWAAKGTYTLGCRAVLASSYERIHRSNLVGMGVLPLQFLAGQTHESLGLTGKEVFSVLGLHDDIKPLCELEVQADQKRFKVLCRLDTPVDIQYYKNGGILHTVLRSLL